MVVWTCKVKGHGLRRTGSSEYAWSSLGKGKEGGQSHDRYKLMYTLVVDMNRVGVSEKKTLDKAIWLKVLW